MASAYTLSQLSLYLSHIGLPPKYHPAQSSSPPLDLELLTLLHRYHITAIPYENLNLHYSTTYAVTLDPQDLFQKIVLDGRGRGGYCMESAILFHHMLRALGFRVYMAGVRIRARDGGVPGGPYIGWVHIVNIVTLQDNSKYSLDVAFGGDGPTSPLPLIHDQPQHNLGTQEIRLYHGPIPDAVDQTQKLWIYQYRNGPTMEWNSFYCFPEIEFLHADFGVMNHYTSTSFNHTNFQVRRPIIVKFLRSEVGGEVVGKVMLTGPEIKRNMGGKTELVKVCKSEEERVQAIKEIFGISLTEEQALGITGRISALPSALVNGNH